MVMPGAAATVLPRCAPPHLVEQNARLALGTRYSLVLHRTSHVESVRLHAEGIFRPQRQDNLASRVVHHRSFRLASIFLPGIRKIDVEDRISYEMAK